MKDETPHSDSEKEASWMSSGLRFDQRITDRFIKPRSWRQLIVFELIVPIVLYTAIGSLFFFLGLKCR